MKIVYLIPVFSVNILAHSTDSIIHYHVAEYLIYLVAGFFTFNILKFFIKERRINENS